MPFKYTFVVIAIACTLLGCEKDELAQLAQDGKATGSACRHAGRAIEDCFAINPDASRAAVFDGWKEMNDYMRENKIAEIIPVGATKDAQHVASNEEATTADVTETENSRHGGASTEPTAANESTTNHHDSTGEK
jgi:hypothetical protein